MRNANLWALAVSIVSGVAFAVCMTYYQWNWYYGWPWLTFAQGLWEWGWPTTFLNARSYTSKPYDWIFLNLAINSVFCALLSISFAFIVWRVVHSLLSSRGRIAFSMFTLLMVTLCTGATFGLWKLVHFVPSIGIQRWYFSATSVDIPIMLFVLVVVGLFCLAMSLATIARKVVQAVSRRLASRAHPERQAPQSTNSIAA